MHVCELVHSTDHCALQLCTWISWAWNSPIARRATRLSAMECWLNHFCCFSFLCYLCCHAVCYFQQWRQLCNHAFVSVCAQDNSESCESIGPNFQGIWFVPRTSRFWASQHRRFPDLFWHGPRTITFWAPCTWKDSAALFFVAHKLHRRLSWLYEVTDMSRLC